jgi:hypothetical protein
VSFFSKNGNKDLKTLSIPFTVKEKVLVLLIKKVFIPILFKVLVILSIISLLDSTLYCTILNIGIITIVLFFCFNSNFKCKVPSPKKNPQINIKQREILFSGILMLGTLFKKTGSKLRETTLSLILNL